MGKKGLKINGLPSSVIRNTRFVKLIYGPVEILFCDGIRDGACFCTITLIHLKSACNFAGVSRESWEV